MNEKESNHFTEIEKRINDEIIHCLICDHSDELYHRSTARNLTKIAENGEIKPSADTKVVSLSASGHHTFGGPIRLKFNKRDLVNAEPMCYAKGDDYSKYSSIRDSRVSDEFPLNRVSADLGVTSSIYDEECEVMSRESIPTDRIEESEYWLTGLSTYNVSCRRQLPSYIDGTGWGGRVWEDVKREIDEARSAANRLGVPFTVKSCFSQVRLGWNTYMPLDEENLKRMSNGQEPKVLEGVQIPDVGREDCQC